VSQSGARIVEVGTTNRTYARDYEAAIDDDAAAILRVHRSNFRIVGFTNDPSIEDLTTLAHARGLLLIDDLGSGALVPTERFGLAHEPMVQESLAAGADLVLFSGDKLLGGPQCGIVAGRAALIERLRRHPLARVLRVDKTTLAALEATLDAYVRDAYREEVPVWRMLSAPLDRQRSRAQAWVEAAGAGAVVSARTMVGGGSLPEEGVGTWVACIPCGEGASRAASALRLGSPAIVARVERGNLVLDPRTVDERDDDVVAAALRPALEAARA
jgi:L-seryl-tRNA(Ser) seleniumtransferase